MFTFYMYKKLCKFIAAIPVRKPLMERDLFLWRTGAIGSGGSS